MTSELNLPFSGDSVGADLTLTTEMIDPRPLPVGGSLIDAIREVAALSPTAAALKAPGLKPLDYRQLVGQFDHVMQVLRSAGIGRQDRVAVVVPDSAELAVVLMSVMACATVVAINPRSTPAELERHMRTAKSVAVILPDGAEAATRSAVVATGLPVFRLTLDPSRTAGRFTLAAPEGVVLKQFTPGDEAASPATATDIALIAQTSGTTGKSKVVPLTHANLLHVMLGNCKVLGLTERDSSLGVMPLYHIHGFAAVLCSLLTGGCAIVTNGFKADEFYGWLDQFEPTWYTAVPTVHRAVLDKAANHPDTIRRIAEGRKLRFVRSGSAPMPKGIPAQLESTFNTTYVEASGATEGSLFCSNRHDNRRIGSVGMPMPGTEVRIIDAAGKTVPPGVEGELVARGPGLFAGYEDDPQTTAASFIDGFFRSGDLGKYDQDGYFYITGRIKEQINRAGMKISPKEVDDVLVGHPAVAQAVTFAMPDERLGEEVAAAIILKPGQSVAEPELQRFAAQSLADHKVPRRFVFVEEFPKGPTGKVLRIGMAQKLGLGVAAPQTPAGDAAVATAPAQPSAHPATTTERTLSAIWSAVLGRSVDDVNAAFTAMGADSLQALSACLLVEQRFGRAVPLATLASCPTIRELGKLIDADGVAPVPGAPVMLRDGDTSRPTLFIVAGIGGNVYRFHSLLKHLPRDLRVVGLTLPGADGLEAPMTSIDAVADRFVGFMKQMQPTGPYLISGYSFGGRVAFAVAERLLREQPGSVRMLGMFDTPGPGWPKARRLADRLGVYVRRVKYRWERVAQLVAGSQRRGAAGPSSQTDAIQSGLAATPGQELSQAALVAARQEAYEAMTDGYRKATRHWKPTTIAAPIYLFRAEVSVWGDRDVSDEAMGWSALTTAGVEVTRVPGVHDTLFQEPNVTTLGAKLVSSMAQR